MCTIWIDNMIDFLRDLIKPDKNRQLKINTEERKALTNYSQTDSQLDSHEMPEELSFDRHNKIDELFFIEY